MVSGPARVARVRIICLDEGGAVLLMRWRDSVTRRIFWEPPGGGIEEGESPRQAAERELREEAGYLVSLSEDFLEVPRDYHWLGRRFVHREGFFVARVGGEPTAPQFTREERETFLGQAFVPPDALSAFDEPLEPPTLPAIIAALSRRSLS